MDLYYDAIRGDFYDLKTQCPPSASPVGAHTNYMSINIVIVPLEHIMYGDYHIILDILSPRGLS